MDTHGALAFFARPDGTCRKAPRGTQNARLRAARQSQNVFHETPTLERMFENFRHYTEALTFSVPATILPQI